jgi:hypothetical protein
MMPNVLAPDQSDLDLTISYHAKKQLIETMEQVDNPDLIKIAKEIVTCWYHRHDDKYKRVIMRILTSSKDGFKFLLINPDAVYDAPMVSNEQMLRYLITINIFLLLAGSIDLSYLNCNFLECLQDHLEQVMQIDRPKYQYRVDDEDIPKGQAGMKTLLKLESVMDYLSDDDLFNSICSEVGFNNWGRNAALGWILAIYNDCLNGSDDVRWFFNYFKISQMHKLKAVKRLKTFHAIVRNYPFDIVAFIRTGEISRPSLEKRNKLMYLQCLFNRDERYPYSAVDEIKARSIEPPKLVDLRDNNLVFIETTKVMRELLSTVEINSLLSMEEHFTMLKTRVAAGSAPGFTFSIGDERIRVNKKLAIWWVDFEEYIREIGFGDLIIHSRNAVKLENGKTRALWNSSMALYILMDFVVSPFEAKINHPEYGSTYDLQDHYKLNFLMSVLFADDQTKGFMSDYVDFNIRHNLELMSQMFLEIGRWYNDKELGNSPQYVQACTWLAKANLDVWLEMPGHIISKVKRGLLTGLRVTNVVNSFFNIVYGRVVEKTCHDIIPTCPLFVKTVTQGDDGARLYKNEFFWGAFFTLILNYCGYTAQILKQLEANDRIEFLRNLGEKKGKRWKRLPSLNRALAGAVAGEYDKEKNLSPYEYAASYWENIVKLKQRGLDNALGVSLLLCFIDSKLKYWLNGRCYTPDLRVLGAPRVLGGMGCDFEGDSRVSGWSKPHNWMQIMSKVPSIRRSHVLQYRNKAIIEFSSKLAYKFHCADSRPENLEVAITSVLCEGNLSRHVSRDYMDRLASFLRDKKHKKLIFSNKEAISSFFSTVDKLTKELSSPVSAFCCEQLEALLTTGTRIIHEYYGLLSDLSDHLFGIPISYLRALKPIKTLKGWLRWFYEVDPATCEGSEMFAKCLLAEQQEVHLDWLLGDVVWESFDNNLSETEAAISLELILAYCESIKCFSLSAELKYALSQVVGNYVSKYTERKFTT